jgi:hypothetical protein
VVVDGKGEPGWLSEFWILRKIAKDVREMRSGAVPGDCHCASGAGDGPVMVMMMVRWRGDEDEMKMKKMAVPCPPSIRLPSPCNPIETPKSK